MPDTTKFYLTTAIDYPNSRPHIGTAFEKIGADVQARYRRMEGYDVLFLMGNDENTIKVSKRAAELGRDPRPTATTWPASSARSGAPSTSATTTSSRPASRGTTPAAGSSSRRSTTTATSTRGSTRAGTATAARRSRPRRSSRTPAASAPTTRRRRSAAASRATSSRLSAFQDRLLAYYEAEPRLHPAGEPAQRDRQPRQDGPAGRQHHAHAARRGASASRSTRSSRSTSGSTPC